MSNMPRNVIYSRIVTVPQDSLFPNASNESTIRTLKVGLRDTLNSKHKNELDTDIAVGL